MKNIDIARGLVFQKLGISKESFDDRLKSQKKIYLLQSLGTNLGYDYNWYIHGPYSPTLADDIYNNIDVLSSTNFSQYKIKETVANKIDLVNRLTVEPHEKLTDASWYELLASLLYIARNKKSWQISSGPEQKQEIFDNLLKYKPQYNQDQCENAYQVLCKNDFLKAGAENGQSSKAG